jgi:hypothetical protein
MYLRLKISNELFLQHFHLHFPLLVSLAIWTLFGTLFHKPLARRYLLFWRIPIQKFIPLFLFLLVLFGRIRHTCNCVNLLVHSLSLIKIFLESIDRAHLRDWIELQL